MEAPTQILPECNQERGKGPESRQWEILARTSDRKPAHCTQLFHRGAAMFLRKHSHRRVNSKHTAH